MTRVLLIAEAANPELVSVPLEGWCHSQAIMRQVDAHLVTQVRNGPAIERAGLARSRYSLIDSERVAAPLYKLGEKLRGGKGKGWTTMMALQSLSYRYFEKLVWREFGARIGGGGAEFSVVHRLTPLSPTVPSRLATLCRRAGAAFVMGPLNGGVPWPKGFDAVRRKEREWLSYVRGVHRLLPGYRATRRDATGLIAGSMDAWGQLVKYADKCVYIPENGVDPARFPERPREPWSKNGGPMRVAFIGRLVPYKCADVLIEAGAELVRSGRMTIEIFGDGPEMPRLREMVSSLGLGRGGGSGSGIELAGWVEHAKLSERLTRCHVFGFPSVREFGGAVVLEAMSQGLVPVVVDYGGPGELVSEGTGVKVPIGTRAEIVARMRRELESLAADPVRVDRMGSAARRRALGLFSWDAKAASTVEVYRWVRGERERPRYAMPLRDE